MRQHYAFENSAQHIDLLHELGLCAIPFGHDNEYKNTTKAIENLERIKSALSDDEKLSGITDTVIQKLTAAINEDKLMNEEVAANNSTLSL